MGLAKLAARPPEGPQWAYEIKWHGYRLALHIEPSGIRVLTRGGHDWTHRFPANARRATSGRSRRSSTAWRLCWMNRVGPTWRCKRRWAYCGSRLILSLHLRAADAVLTQRRAPRTDRAGGGNRPDDRRRKARLRHFRRARGIRTRAHCRTHPRRTGGRPRAWTRGRPQAKDDARKGPPRHGGHGEAGNERREALRGTRRHVTNALPTCLAKRRAPGGR